MNDDRLAKRRASYAALSEQQKAARRLKEKEARARRIARETSEERERRLAMGREASRRNRMLETPEQRNKRLAYMRAYKAEYTSARAAEIAEKSRAYYQKNKDKILASSKAYRQTHRDMVNERSKRKRIGCRQFAVSNRLRHRVYMAVRKADARKRLKTLVMTGCSVQFLCGWLESQFTDGMSWQNMGQWHIDHIIPCAAFDMTDESQQLVAFHYTNLRPLWGKENSAKRDRLPMGLRGPWTLESIAIARKLLGIRMHVAEPA